MNVGFGSFPDAMPCPYGPFRAIVVDVHDGDTVRLLIDTGFGQRAEESIRIYGINAPELASKEGKASRDFLAGLLPVGSFVRLTSLVGTTNEQTQSFTRYVGSIEYHDTIANGGKGKVFDVATVMVICNRAVYCDRNLRPTIGSLPPIPRWVEPVSPVKLVPADKKMKSVGKAESCPRCHGNNVGWYGGENYILKSFSCRDCGCLYDPATFNIHVPLS